MLVTITFGTASGKSAQLDVEPDVTSMDVLSALSEDNVLGVNANAERYVVSSPRLGRDLSPDETLRDAGIVENDLLTVDRSEQGYRLGCRAEWPLRRSSVE